MKNVIKFALAAATLVAFTGAAYAEGDAAKGAKIFNRCKACHKVGPKAKNGVGPELNGVVGRTIGTAPGYKYSPGYIAMGEKGMKWDDALLAKYIPDPKGFLKAEGVTVKSKMTPQKLKEDQLADVIAYLKTFPAEK